MGRLLKSIGAAALALGALAAPPARAASEFDYGVELRAVSADATSSRLTGGLGALRYDSTHEGLRLGYARLGYRGQLTDTLRVAVEAVAYGDRDVNPAGITEAYAEWRPLPSGAWRSRVKLGAFYPEISLENRMKGWRSPYTLSWSAINTWVGEELRTIGGEYSLDWLGLAHGHDWEASASVAAFGWNDPAGVVVATRGWGLHDRQTTLTGRFANQGSPFGPRTLFFDDLDKRAGAYGALALKWRGLLELRALHYDNRARLGVEAPAIRDATWLTRFESVGARWTPTEQLTVIGQWLHGRTFEDPLPDRNAWSFASTFVLASWKQGPWRWSTRWDRFDVRQTESSFEYIPFLSADDGWAATFAVARQLGAHWHATLEWVRADTVNNVRPLLGLAAAQRERQVQLALSWQR